MNRKFKKNSLEFKSIETYACPNCFCSPCSACYDCSCAGGPAMEAYSSKPGGKSSTSSSTQSSGRSNQSAG